MLILFSMVFFDLSLTVRAQTVGANQLSEVSSQVATAEDLTAVSFSDGEKYNDTGFYRTVSDGSMEIDPKTIPKIRTNDGMPLCETFCPTVLAEFKLCKERNIPDCSKLDDDQRISPISTLRYRDTNNPIDETVIGDISSRGRKLAFQIMDTITTVAGSQYFYSESCLPFNEFVKKFKENKDLLAEEIDSIRKLYDYAKSKLGTEANVQSCPGCLEKMKEKFDLFLPKKGSLGEIAAAIKLKDFNTFMHSMLFLTQMKEDNPECKVIEIENSLRAKHFPEPNGPTVSVDALFKKIDELLAKKIPVVLPHLCAAKRVSDGKCDSHCVVITGRKRVQNIRTKQEVELVRVHNSWGDGWQKANNDGWVTLDKLKSMVRTIDDIQAKNPHTTRKQVSTNAISWF